MDLNDLVPCVCDSCLSAKESRKIDIANTMYFKAGHIPLICPLCSAENTIREVRRVCLVKGLKNGGNFKATKPALRQYRGMIREWIYYCERSKDEHTRHNLPVHTSIPECCTCPECLVNYNQDLELASVLLRTRS
jgi:hypothetical protein